MFIIQSVDGFDHAEPIGVSPAFTYGLSCALFSAVESLFQVLTTWTSVSGRVVVRILCVVAHS